MNNDNGGPAFPLQSIGPDFAPGYAGMTLRDYFAAKVMAVYLLPDPTSGAWSGQSEFCGLAALAYKAADAMLKARTAAQGDAL